MSENKATFKTISRWTLIVILACVIGPVFLAVLLHVSK